MEAFLEEVGFSYAPTAGGFDHLTRTTILDAEGRVYRHVYGDQFPMQVFVEPLKELILGSGFRAFSLDGLLERVRFLCTVYDATTGAYRIDYSLGFGIVIGAISLILMGILLIRVWRNNRRLEQTQARP
jgi:protein SCO1/2